MATEVPWSKDGKYPLPFDAFLFLTVLIPGALVLLLLPADPGVVHGTVFERITNSDKWHVYPAMVIASFVLGALADIGGRILREVLYATALWTRLPTNKEIQEKLSTALSFDPHAAELTAANLWRHRTMLLTIAGQVPRGKAFRAYDRTLAMITNLV